MFIKNPFDLALREYDVQTALKNVLTIYLYFPYTNDPKHYFNMSNAL